MKFPSKCFLGLLAFSCLSSPAFSASSPNMAAGHESEKATAKNVQDSNVSGTITLNAVPIAYHAVSGTLSVHDAKYDDSDKILKERGDLESTDEESKKSDDEDAAKKNPAVASMFYTAYFKDGAQKEKRPIVFFYNGGPGSSSLWLHIGSFGPVRVVTPGDSHLPAPPYKLAPNAESLLDIADLVFIDAPGTGFGRIGGDKAEETFFGVDGDAHAFASFIEKFLTKYDRFNSPRYLFGESYGTLRSAVVAKELQQNAGLDLNGVILLSQILSYDNNIDTPDYNPGNDMPYALALPTYTATAWYHHRLGEKQAAELQPLLKEVEDFAMNQYLPALNKGSDLSDEDKKAVAQKLHAYTGLSEAYLLRADLRVTGLMFTQELQRASGLITGRLGTEYSAPAVDLMEKNSLYDPQSDAISSAYVSTFNQYVRQTLKFGEGMPYRFMNESAEEKWDTSHKLPQAGSDPYKGTTNVMSDLALAMKTNPNLKIMLNGGYYDLATPYYEGLYEMNHLPIPQDLRKNIEIYQYPAGHMVYLNQDVLKDLHKNVAGFIKRTSESQ
ncbi:peptidase S10 [Acetobacteraceae bacterium]|nr:peptidase S10 [Acetobacteraceae bacterium]